MTNAYEGDVPIRIGAREVVLKIDYRAVGALITLFDDKDWPGAINSAFEQYDMELVAKIIRIAARRHQPDLTEEEVLDASPPFQVAFKAIEAALYLFLWGSPHALENLDLEEPEKAEGEASGKGPLTSPRARWRERGASRLSWLLRQVSFGG